MLTPIAIIHINTQEDKSNGMTYIDMHISFMAKFNDSICSGFEDELPLTELMFKSSGGLHTTDDPWSVTPQSILDFQNITLNKKPYSSDYDMDRLSRIAKRGKQIDKKLDGLKILSQDNLEVFCKLLKYLKVKEFMFAKYAESNHSSGNTLFDIKGLEKAINQVTTKELNRMEVA